MKFLTLFWLSLHLVIIDFSFAPDPESDFKKFDVEEFFKHVGESNSLDQLIPKVTGAHTPTTFGLFFATGSELVDPENPQVYFHAKNATIAYGNHDFLELFVQTDAGDTITIQVEEKEGRLVVNDTPGLNLKKFAALHEDNLALGTRSFGDKACAKCHISRRRRIIEPEDQQRRFLPGQWFYRDEQARLEIKANLAKIFDRFTKANHASVRWKWLWRQPQVLARGGELTPKDTFTLNESYRQLLQDTTQGLLTELIEKRDFNKLYPSFIAGLVGRGDFVEILAETSGESKEALYKELNALIVAQAEGALKHWRHRNYESSAWINSGGDASRKSKYKEESPKILLGPSAVRKIGPEILKMIVSDGEYEKLSNADKAKKIPLSEFWTKDLAEIERVASSLYHQDLTERKAMTMMVISRLVGNKNRARAYLSTGLKISTESGDQGNNMIDFYLADAARRWSLEENPMGEGSEKNIISLMLLKKKLAQMDADTFNGLMGSTIRKPEKRNACSVVIGRVGQVNAPSDIMFPIPSLHN